MLQLSGTNVEYLPDFFCSFPNFFDAGSAYRQAIPTDFDLSVLSTH